MRKRMPLIKLRAFAHVIDFFGGMFLIRGGKASVPGSRVGVGGHGWRVAG